MSDSVYVIGRHKYDLDTPALMLDIAAMERNLQTMTQFFLASPVKLRPHVKLHHATPMLAHRQLAAAGRHGLTCAKLAEAELLVTAGITDILIANQIVGEHKIHRLMHLARQADLIVAVDHPDNVDQLSTAAQKHRVTIGILVEVNIGHNRCGVAPGVTALQLAQQVHQAPGLRLLGIMGYDGHCTVKVSPLERESKSLEANRLLVTTCHMLENAGLPVEIVSASGTFTYRYAASLPGINEVQAGTYLLMDSTFYDKGVTEFEQTLSILGTVTSRPTYPGAEGLAIIDVGRKTIDSGWGLPSVKYPAGAEITSLSQEHGRMRLQSSAAALSIGDRVELRVVDANTTINLFDHFYVIRDDRVEAVWDIPGRGASS